MIAQLVEYFTDNVRKLTVSDVRETNFTFLSKEIGLKNHESKDSCSDYSQFFAVEV
jgi:hypothetical protein